MTHADAPSVTQGSVIWKFTLRPWTIFLDVPRGAQILSVGAQGDDIVAWALCDEDAPYEARLLAAHPTGTPLPFAFQGARFLGTVQMDDGLVFHVFEGDGPKGTV